MNGRPVQLHSLLCAAAASGGIKLFRNKRTRGGVLLDEAERVRGDDERVLGAAVKGQEGGEDGTARFQMPAPARALETTNR